MISIQELLTPREKEVLYWMTKGYTNREIALVLVISNDTVKTHVERILSKMRAKNRTEAAVIAARLGLDTDPSIYAE